jgi:phage protein D
MSTTNSIELGGLSKQYSARDLPAQQKLKYRDIGQAPPEEVKKDKRELRKELDEREKIATSKDNANNKRLSITDKEATATSASALSAAAAATSKKPK